MGAIQHDILLLSHKAVYNRRLSDDSPMQSTNLTHHFLIAMPATADPFFSNTLTYICEHNERGALGLVINRVTNLTLGNLFEQFNIPFTDPSFNELPVLFGGPVQLDCSFVLHQPAGNWQSTIVVNSALGLTTSSDILQAIANGKGPEQTLVTLGYSGWASGQIEYELTQNAWLTVNASPSIIFELPPDKRLSAAMELLGINFSSLSGDAGHS